MGGTGRTGFLLGKSLENDEDIIKLKKQWNENSEKYNCYKMIYK
jgi:hypothetical protein